MSLADPSRPAPPSEEDDLVDEVVQEARHRLARDSRVRRRLPGKGMLFVDGLTPFLAVYRPPPDREDPGTRQLVTSLRSYLLAPEHRPELARTVAEGVLTAMVAELGGALVLELWSGPTQPGEEAESGPRLRVHGADTGGQTVKDFVDRLSGLRVLPSREAPPGGDRAQAEAVRSETLGPPGRKPLLGGELGDEVVWIGLEVPPLHFDAETGRPYPERLHFLRRELSLGIERAVHAWSSRCTRFDAAHPHALGRRTLGRSGRAIDARLADVAEAFDLILGISPVNVDEMWQAFESSGRQNAPRFQYRPLVFDPEELKQRLFRVPVERIEDPLAADLIREKQEELDLRITMLRNRGRATFLLHSLELFGRPDAELAGLARRTLEAVPQSDGPQPGAPCVGAEAFLSLAREEAGRFRSRAPDFPTDFRIWDDLSSGILVTHGVLCVNRNLSLSPHRARALVQHEVGTHVLTYYNGSRQDLRLLRTGLAGYGALQEGLAVLAEYLVGGLTRSRVRTLAARVVAVECLVDGADFVETFGVLTRDFGLGPRGAFGVTVRCFRGGGCTKDMQYLEGLRDLLQYLRGGGEISTLFVGKVGLAHISLVHELMLRGIIRGPVVLPRYTEDDAAMKRLEGCRRRTAMDLFQEARS
jgi:uncharacterized protein (TIGR02421 family)